MKPFFNMKACRHENCRDIFVTSSCLSHRRSPRSSLFSVVSPSSKRRAFTLVELLVVILIISILIALLLPALAKARRLALRVACSANVRSLTMATIMYADDNRDVLMDQGMWRMGSVGIYDFGPNTSLLNFFHEYLNVPEQYTGVYSGGVTENGVWGIAYNVQYNTPGVLICPSAPTQPNYYEITYGYMTGGCSSYAMRLMSLESAGNASRDYAPYTPIPVGLPALWADLYFIDNPALTWFSGPIHTNHPARGGLLTGVGGGGNVGRVDGSVVWMPLNATNPKAVDSYVTNYGVLGNAQAIPSDTVLLNTDGGDNISTTWVKVIMGSGGSVYPSAVLPGAKP